ncbi:MAG TPA: hypothetical protein VKA63_02850, partial [Candidatus Krumholzibacteria bacterium]|nr:hypothetical protein [Candidatus Krumholzibacteria bacterium]
YTRKGKGTTRFVRRDNLATVKKQLRNYAKLRALVDRWVDLAIELSDVKLEETKRVKLARRR